MPRTKGPKTTPVTIRLAPDLVEIIDALASGIFGQSRSDVARYLIRTRLEEIVDKELPRKLKALKTKP